jgi:hypothetical protein
MVHSGEQTIKGEDFELPLYYNGRTTIFYHNRTMPRDKGLPKHTLTSELPYRPKNYMFLRAMEYEEKPEDFGESQYQGDIHWSPIETESVDVEFTIPRSRQRYIWEEATSHNWRPHQLAEWHKRLGCANDEVIKKTFLATTQAVPSVQHENELLPKNTRISRFPILAHRRLKEVVSCDIVWLDDNKKKPAMLFYGESSKILAIYPLKTCSSGKTLEVLWEFVRDFGAPRVLLSDHANNLCKANNWKHVCLVTSIKQRTSEPGKHSSNTVE